MRRYSPETYVKTKWTKDGTQNPYTGMPSQRRRKPAAPIVKEYDLDYFAAQMFDECLQAGMSTCDARHHTRLFKQQARNDGPRTPAFEDFRGMRDALFGDGPCDGPRFERWGGRGGPVFAEEYETPGFGRMRGGRKPIFAETYAAYGGPYQNTETQPPLSNSFFGGFPGRHTGNAKTHSPPADPFFRSPFGSSLHQHTGSFYQTEERRPGGSSSDSSGYTEYPAGFKPRKTGPGTYKYSYESAGTKSKPYGHHGEDESYKTRNARQNPHSNYRRDSSHGCVPPGGLRRSSTYSIPRQGLEPDVCFYTVLGVSKTASMEEIKKAHRKLCLKWHPDRAAAGQRKEATEKTALINQARDVLVDGKQQVYCDRTGWMPSNPGV